MDKEILFKDLLFSLRYEYLKIQDTLNSLKQYIQLSDEETENFYFSILKPFLGGNPQLIITFVKNGVTGIKVLDDLLKKIGIDIYREFSEKILKSGDTYYFKNLNFPITIKDNCLEEFNASLSSIFVSLFINSINSYTEFHNYALSTTPSNLIFYISNSHSFSLLSCTYSPNNDIVAIDSSDIVLSSDSIQSIFETTIPTSMLSDYHQIIVTNNPFYNKSLEIVESTKKSKHVQYSVLEDEKKLVLQRRI